MSKRATSRITVTVPKSAKAAIKRIADEQGSSVSGAVKQMITRELAIEGCLREGKGVFISRDIYGNLTVIEGGYVQNAKLIAE